MQRLRLALWFLTGLLLLSCGFLLYLQTGALVDNCSDCIWLSPQRLTSLSPGTAASMDSPVFTFSEGWTANAQGSDPPEPPKPFEEPAGVVSFPYTGSDLYLLLAPGNYWAYLYITVDGLPANRLPVIGGNRNSQGELAAYKPLLAPERAPDSGSHEPLWLLVHQAQQPDDAAEPQNVRIEIWRGWDQTPLRGVGVDLPPNTRTEIGGQSLAQASVQRWPSVLLMVLGAWLLGVGAWRLGKKHAPPVPQRSAYDLQSDTSVLHRRVYGAAHGAAALGLLLIAASIFLPQWFLCLGGLLLLALGGLVRPSLWIGALLFGLPFAYGIKLPMLPARSFDLIDIGVWGAAAILLGHIVVRRRLLGPLQFGQSPISFWGSLRRLGQEPSLWALAALVIWALVPTVAASYADLALREWRVVFLTPLVFGGVLALAFHLSRTVDADRSLLVASWLSGAAVISLFGLWGYLVGNQWVSQAEGVRRIQAFYGSANNLALYLDRTLAVSLALAIFVPAGRLRLLWIALAAPQVLAFLLTFSKGSLLLAAPAMALVLLGGGGWLLHRQGRSLRPLWILLGIGVGGLLVLAPFLGAERFQRLFDLGQGTGFLRLQLWRSAWQMGLDHPLLGVGPDNFLYAYRSGYLLPSAWQEPNLNHPHNLLLDFWTRLGLPGLALGLAWLGLGTWSVVRWLRSGPQRPLALGVLAATAAGLAHGLIDVSYALPELMIVWVWLFGLAASFRRQQP
jgi:O-antigen ligase